jgi:hypothetical protein
MITCTQVKRGVVEVAEGTVLSDFELISPSPWNHRSCRGKPIRTCLSLKKRDQLPASLPLRTIKPGRYPKLSGSIKITDEEGKIVIAGDPEGLRSHGALLTWFGDQDLAAWPYLTEGQHAHLHIYPRIDISEASREMELMRSDTK